MAKGYEQGFLKELWCYVKFNTVKKCRFENAVHESGEETAFFYFGNIKDIHPTYFKFITK